jgi:cytochrome c oxidase assembly protein subunit 17
MSTTVQTTNTNTTEEQPKLKICCACPETKKPRDECVVQFGEEKCQDLIEAHKVCLQKHGFKV